MLVLSREPDQAVIISFGSARVRMSVVSVRGDKVRLGFDADTSVTIHREEVQLKVDKEGEA